LLKVLITNKQSNILQDNETLHLFARTVSEFCRSLKESEITEHSFELALAFDEIISMGYRENVTLQQIKTNVEMESQEEKLQEMLQKVFYLILLTFCLE
jgi:coatomer subunit delta